MTKPKTPNEEHAFYADPVNQTPKGPAVRPRAPLGDPVPVRFPPTSLRRCEARRRRTTARSRAGSGGLSSANSNGSPHSDTRWHGSAGRRDAGDCASRGWSGRGTAVDLAFLRWRR